MKSKVLIGLIALSFLTVSVSAQNSSNDSINQSIDRGPGMIGAGSPIYGLETAWDSAAVSIGIKSAGNVAQERAAEAKQAQEKGNTRAVERATRNLQKVANKSKDSDEEGINKAMETMEEVIANAPNDQARQGMQNALENMQKAQGKRNEARAQNRGPENNSDMSPENRTENMDRMERQNQSDNMERDSTNSTNTSNMTQEGNMTQEERQREQRNETEETQNRSTGNPR